MDENNNILAEVLGSLVNNRDGNFSNNGGFMWVVFMFFMMFWGGNNGYGFFGNRNGFGSNVATQGDVAASTAWGQTQDGIRDVLQSVHNSNAPVLSALQGIDNDIRTNNLALNQLGYNMLEQSNATNQQLARQGFDLQSAIMAGNGLLGGAIAKLGGDTQLAICQSNNNTQNAIRDVGFGIQTAVYQTANQTHSDLQRLAGDTQLAICQSTNGTQNAINNNSNAIQGAIRETGNSALQGITSLGFLTQQKTDELKYELARSTNAITNNASSNTQKVLDKLCSMEANLQAQRIQELQIQNQSLALQNQVKDLQAGQLASAGFIINSIRPYPVPAYTVTSPYGTVTPTTGTTTTP